MARCDKCFEALERDGKVMKREIPMMKTRKDRPGAHGSFSGTQCARLREDFSIPMWTRRRADRQTGNIDPVDKMVFQRGKHPDKFLPEEQFCCRSAWFRKARAAVITILFLLLLPKFVGKMLNWAAQLNRISTEGSYIQIFSRLFGNGDQNSRSRSAAMWIDHVVIDSNFRILIPESFEGRFNAEVAPLLESHLDQIWENENKSKLECHQGESILLAFSMSKSADLSASITFDGPCSHGGIQETCVERAIISDIRDLVIQPPKQTSRFMYTVSMEKRRNLNADDENEVDVMWVKPLGTANGWVEVDLSDGSRVALQRYCGNNRKLSAINLISEPLNGQNTRIISIYELKRLFGLISRHNAKDKGTTISWNRQELSKMTIYPLEHSRHAMTEYHLIKKLQAGTSPSPNSEKVFGNLSSSSAPKATPSLNYSLATHSAFETLSDINSMHSARENADKRSQKSEEITDSPERNTSSDINPPANESGDIASTAQKDVDELDGETLSAPDQNEDNEESDSETELDHAEERQSDTSHTNSSQFNMEEDRKQEPRLAPDNAHTSTATQDSGDVPQTKPFNTDAVVGESALGTNIIAKTLAQRTTSAEFAAGPRNPRRSGIEEQSQLHQHKVQGKQVQGSISKRPPSLLNLFASQSIMTRQRTAHKPHISQLSPPSVQRPNNVVSIDMRSRHNAGSVQPRVTFLGVTSSITQGQARRVSPPMPHQHPQRLIHGTPPQYNSNPQRAKLFPATRQPSGAYAGVLASAGVQSNRGTTAAQGKSFMTTRSRTPDKRQSRGAYGYDQMRNAPTPRVLYRRT